MYRVAQKASYSLLGHPEQLTFWASLYIFANILSKAEFTCIIKWLLCVLRYWLCVGGISIEALLRSRVATFV